MSRTWDTQHLLPLIPTLAKMAASRGIALAGIEPHLPSEILMESLRREARLMDREQLIQAIDQLSQAFSVQRAAAVWAVGQAAGRPFG